MFSKNRVSPYSLWGMPFMNSESFNLSLSMRFDILSMHYFRMLHVLWDYFHIHKSLIEIRNIVKQMNELANQDWCQYLIYLDSEISMCCCDFLKATKTLSFLIYVGVCHFALIWFDWLSRQKMSNLVSPHCIFKKEENFILDFCLKNNKIQYVG